MNPYNLGKGAITGVGFFGLIIAMVINANFIPLGVAILAPICIIITYFVLGPLFKKLDVPIGDKEDESSTGKVE